MKYDKKIIKIVKSSPAKRAKLKVGDIIQTINDEELIDFIDVDYFNSLENLEINLLRENKNLTFNIRKESLEPIGVVFKENIYPPDIYCQNRCIFCFVDQLPIGMRKSLYIKDDDWRYSVAFGNYITLTNIDEKDIDRIIRRKASPLYVSVHCVDGELRSHMMGNDKAKNIKAQLEKLCNNSIIIHTQVVLCPGINDSKYLDESIEYLSSLYPQVRSLAVVPVGLTQHRKGLTELGAVDNDIANKVIDKINDYSKKYNEKLGTQFVYAADEFYQKAGLPYPIYKDGKHNSQLSNGVGMFSEFISEFDDAIIAFKPKLENILSKKNITIITGVSAYEEISKLIKRINNLTFESHINVCKVFNSTFGESITVSGLLSGEDIYNALKVIDNDVIIVPSSSVMSKSDINKSKDISDSEKIFLDDISILELQKKLNSKIIICDVDGYTLVKEIIRIS